MLIACLAAAHAQTDATPQPGDTAPSAQLVEQARELLAAGDAKSCIDLLESALRQWPADTQVWLAILDAGLSDRRFAQVLRQCDVAQHALAGEPAVHWRAAQARYALNEPLGRLRIEHHPDGRAGQFRRDRLLIEPTERPEWFLVCGPESALYQVRKAIDGGVNDPAAHLLHARIWQQRGRPDVAKLILDSHRAELLSAPSSHTLDTFADLALATGALDEYLHYCRLHADLNQPQADQVMRQAYAAVAAKYRQSGEPALEIAFLRRAALSGPPEADVMLELADALWPTGAQTEATVWYRRALETAPEHLERGRILGRLATAPNLP
jgi:Tfp pilus assembly protein PilF